MRPYPQYKDSAIEWIRDIPFHWEIDKLKYLAGVNNSNVDKKTIDGEIPVRLCNYIDVYRNSYIHPGLLLMAATATEEELDKFRVYEGDVLITKDSESWDDIAIPAYVSKSSTEMVCGYHLSHIRPNTNKIVGKYLFYSFMSDDMRVQFETSANGITRYGIPKFAIDNGIFVVPPLSEQKQIAKYLDHKTAKIDTLIEKKKRLIELLKEERAAVINHAVTKGLDPDAPMKDSGIEWLGEIPEHWDTFMIKRLTRVKRGASPRPIDDPKYFDENGEFAWVRIADVSASERYLKETTQTLSELGASLSVKRYPNDFFLSIAGTVGKPIITKIKCCIHDGFVWFPDLKINPEYLYYIFSTGLPYQGLGKWGTQLNLNTDTVGEIVIPLPSLDEMDSIIEYLDKETACMGSIISKSEEEIELLQEYRTALISEVVTGKIDVREEKI